MTSQTPVPRPPVYELFFAPLAVELNPTDYERVQFAYFASKYGHAGQLRDDGSRYFDHPKAATWIYIEELAGRDTRAIVLLLLHDISEDAYLLSPYRIGVNFGKDTALDVRAVTKLPKKKETTEAYINRVIEQGPWAILAKLCDRLHNLRTLRGCPEEKRKTQIQETLDYHIRLLIPSLHTAGEPWSTYSSKLKDKMHEAINSYM